MFLILTSLSFILCLAFYLYAKFNKKLNRKKISVTPSVIFFVIVILQFIRIIPEGKMGVAHSPFGGTKMNYLLSSGINITNPTIKIALYPSVSQKLIQEIKILSRDGSQVNIKFQTVYRISPRWVTRLHKNVGPNYEDVLLKPEIESMIKVFIGMYNENEIRLISHDMLPILIMSHLNGPDGNSAIAIESSAWL